MKTKFRLTLIILTLIGMIGCNSGKTNHSSAPEVGMFKVAILYPNGENKTFDMGYYEKTHMPLMAKLLGTNLKFYEINQGIPEKAGEQVPYVTIGYFYIHNLEEYNKTIEQHIDTIRQDIPKYTNIQPMVQVSKITKWIAGAGK